MLVASSTPVLTVQRISAHLRVNDWNVARELKRNRLKGRKTRGEGRMGQGGQWEVQLTDYLDWLGVPRRDRARRGPDGLPELHAFSEVAAREGMDLTELTRVVDLKGFAHLRIGRRRYFTRSQLDVVETYLDMTKAPASG